MLKKGEKKATQTEIYYLEIFNVTVLTQAHGRHRQFNF